MSPSLRSDLSHTLHIVDRFGGLGFLRLSVGVVVMCFGRLGGCRLCSLVGVVGCVSC